MSNSTGKTFQEQWAFPSEVKKTLGAASYDVRPLPENFKSGRAKWECLFFAADRSLLSRRTAMALTSKRTGDVYYVCQREAATPRPSAPADLLLDEVYRTP
jgi:hypothetical protein